MRKRSFILTVVMTMILTAMVILGAQQYKLVVNGKNVKCDMIVKNGTTYLPLRTISNELGLALNVQDGTIYLDTTSKVASTNEYTKKITTCAEYINSELFQAYLDVENIVLGVASFQYDVGDAMDIFTKAAKRFVELSENANIQQNAECYMAYVCSNNAAKAFIQCMKELPVSVLNGGFTDAFVQYYEDGMDFSVLLSNELDKCGAWSKYTPR